MAQKVRDTAFTFIFSNETYMAQLYNYLTGKEIHPEDIRSVRLENELTSPRLYNDVACITKDNHLLVMIEHQSTINKNMLFRMMEYYAALVSKFVIKENSYNKYGSKEIQIPKADFHIVYNGKGEMEELPELDLGDIQIQGTVSNVHFNNLNHHQPNHSLVAYAKLIELTEEYKLHINDAIDQLLAEGYLLEFFGRKEVRDMFAEVFSYDQELIDKGVKQGMEQGLEQGIEHGEEKKAIEMAISLLESGMPVGEVCRHSKLSLEVVEGLLSTIKNS